MQDRYVGDVGDFAKYALLRRLCGTPGDDAIRLGVVWCQFPDAVRNNDGRHISYLHAPGFCDLDAELLAALRKIVEAGQRRVSSVRRAGVLPTNTVFYDASVSPPATSRLSREDRLRYRSVWLERCLGATRDCELVFFDPDNGLEVASVPKHHRNAGKYIYWNELEPFWRRGNALLIYHHLNRTMSAAQQTHRLMLRFRANFDGASVTPLVFRRGSCRVFWLVHSGCTVGRKLESRANSLLCGKWSRHFRPFGWPGDDQSRAGARSRSIT